MSSKERCSPQCVKQLGPWGGKGGNSFDDGIHDSVKKIRISDGLVIHSIQFTYIDNGCEIVAPKRGGSDSSNYSEIVLSEGENIISMVGTVGPFPGQTTQVKSLIITTNMNVYGPYGEFKVTPETESLFSVDLSKVSVVGFFGRNGTLLDSLGINVKANCN